MKLISRVQLEFVKKTRRHCGINNAIRESNKIRLRGVHYISRITAGGNVDDARGLLFSCRVRSIKYESRKLSSCPAH